MITFVQSENKEWLFHPVEEIVMQILKLQNDTQIIIRMK